jgi:hypothetical protein
VREDTTESPTRTREAAVTLELAPLSLSGGAPPANPRLLPAGREKSTFPRQKASTRGLGEPPETTKSCELPPLVLARAMELRWWMVDQVTAGLGYSKLLKRRPWGFQSSEGLSA